MGVGVSSSESESESESISARSGVGSVSNGIVEWVEDMGGSFPGVA